MSIFDRNSPAKGKIKERYPLTLPGSTKVTYHITLEPVGDLPAFKPGDSIGIFAKNDPDRVDQILSHTPFSGEEIVTFARTGEKMPLRQFLENKANLARCTKKLLGDITWEGADVREFLQKNPLKIETSDQFAASFAPLLPRFYSIANSPKASPGRIDLTVALLKNGVASHYLCHLAEVGKTSIEYYVQPARHFALPKDETIDIIMVGPGTGIAPFRGFLQEREHLQSSGKNWLFFGERHRATDFLYQDYWESLAKKEQLVFSGAFSRDDKEKIYVQHLMEKESKKLFSWLQSGAYFYVCGDAKHMARDVEETLKKILISEGNLSPEAAKEQLRQMRKAGRYQTDVY